MGGRGRRKIERTVRREYGRAVAFVKSSRARKAVGMEGDGGRGQGQNARGLLPFPIPVTRPLRSCRARCEILSPVVSAQTGHDGRPRAE